MKLLQLSDLHIVSNEDETIYGIDSFKSLERVLRYGLSEEPDLVVITGDLVERGDSESYLRLRGLLSSVDVPVFVLPGNHDSTRRIDEFLVGGNVR